MHYLFEKSDSLNTPIECFIFNASSEVFPVRPHWHYFYEIIYILEGTAEMHCDDKTYILSEGEMIVFHSKSVHSIFSAEQGAIKYAVLKFDINKFSASLDYAPKLRNIFRVAKRNNMNIYFSQEETARMSCKKIFDDCINEMSQQQYGYNLMLKMHIYNLLMSIIRKWLTDGMTINIKDFSNEDNFDIDNITEYIDSIMSENPKVSEIAEKCGMSYSCFAKKFHEVYGMSCKEYIEQMRIFKAEEFLLFTDYDLNYISQETGFSDCSHMIKSFKAIRGVTPKQFRLNRKK